MAITIIDKPRVFRNYLVYDLEWIPGKFSKDGSMPVRLCGVYDGNRYRAYRTVDAFLDGELTHKNRGKWFYAHAGGLADFQFLLEKLIARMGNGWSVKGSTSGSSVIIVHVTRGKNTWHFIDSFWLLKDKLRNIGKWVGIDKGNTDESEEFYRDASDLELRYYNELDCIILYKAIREFELTLYDLGGQLKMTQASCAMDLFRRRFLQRDIATSEWINTLSRRAYYASRVEVLAKYCDDAWYYDVNSSFPYAMTFPIPGALKGTSHRMPESGIYLSDVEIDIPDCYLPPIPTRLGGRLFFPIGRWRGWLMNTDIELLQDQGGRVTRHHESLMFEERTDCGEYARTLYDLRAKSSGFMYIACKYLLNSLYGKFAECDYKSSLEINPPNPKGPDDGWTQLFPGAFIVERKVPIPHMHVPISAHITAIARRTLYLYMSFSPELHYCDTDGFSSVEKLRSTEGKLGCLKLEKTIKQGRFVTQKTYDLLTDSGEHVTRAKGFRKMTSEDFTRMAGYIDAIDTGSIENMSYTERSRLMESTEMDYTRMARTKELLRLKRTKPVERNYKKRLRIDVLPKRCFYPDGQSRPWMMDELKEVLE
jgi:DNA polymerase type B, organellar and viral